MTTLEEYLALPYRITLTPDADEDGVTGWVAEIPDLPGCVSQGATPEEAVERVRDAMAGWVSVALQDGLDIPLPRREPTHSGRVLVRMPPTMHAYLVDLAEQEGVSLNQLIVTALAFDAGRRSAKREAAPA